MKEFEIVRDTQSESEGGVKIKVNSTLYRKMLAKDFGDGLKFSPEKYYWAFMDELMPFFLDLCECAVPRNKEIKTDVMYIYKPHIPVELKKMKKSQGREVIAGKVQSHLKKGGPIEFSMKQNQFFYLLLGKLLKIDSISDMKKLVGLLKNSKVENTGDFINVLQEFIDKRSDTDE